MELLAPAKNIEVARAAIMAGADAVYIGAPQFGARQAAGNSVDDIRALVRYARPFGVKVLVTMNTLMDDNERKQAAAMIGELYQAGVDAIIMQDLRLLNEQLPPIRLHASTQCDNRSPEQVVALQRMGFKRAVLARELTIEQIRAIRRATLADNPAEPIELEVFVHGAVCVSYSGKCFMSERLLGRSANRGACAQCCRMAYDVLDEQGRELHDDEGKPLHQRYVLSLKDMNRSASLRELIDAGVHTIKIEGRLKDADYVTNIVAYYRELLDKCEGKPTANDSLEYKRSFTPDPAKTFHRGGTSYFLHGRTENMANWDSPKSTGEHIGIVTSCRDRSIHVQLLPGVTLHNGDGLCFSNQGFQVNSVTPLSAGSVAVNTFHAIRIPAGTMLYRNTDTAFLKQLRAERRIPVSVRLSVCEQGFELSMHSIHEPQWQVSRRFEYEHTPAENTAKTLDTQRTQLAKLGDTRYVAQEVLLPEQALFVPISQLNIWRREVTAAADELLSNPVEPMRDDTPHKTDESQLPDYSFANEPLMRCKYCILNELGHCRKQPHRLTPDKEPRYLRLQNGTVLELTFHCKECEMTIEATK